MNELQLLLANSHPPVLPLARAAQTGPETIPLAIDERVGERHADEGSEASWKRRSVVTLLLIAHVALGWLARWPGIIEGADAPRYLALARSIRQGDYRDLMWPGAPVEHMYPPGYPALLAAWTSIGGEHVNWLAILHIGLSTATLGLTYATVKRVMGPRMALCVLVALVANPNLIRGVQPTETEHALAFCFALAVWADSCRRGTRQGKWLLLAAALLAPLMRTAGVVLPIALVIDRALSRKYREAATATLFSAVVVVPLALWTLMNPAKQAGASYSADIMVRSGNHGSMLAEMFRRVGSNAIFYATQGIPWVLPAPTIAGTIVDNVLATVVIMSGLVVGALASTRTFRLGALILLTSGVLFAVWPYQIDRFLHPLIPLLVTLLLYGIGVAAPRLHIAARRAVFAAAALVAVTAFTRTAHRIAEVSGCDRSGPLPDLRCVNIEERSFLRAAAYIRGMLPTSARVVSGHSEALYYHTNRVTVRSSVVDAPDSSRFVAAMRRADVAYILLSGLSPAERSSLAPKLSPNCQLLRETAFFPPHTYLLQVALSDTADSGVRPLPRTTELPETSGCAALEQYFRDTDGKPQSVHAP